MTRYCTVTQPCREEVLHFIADCYVEEVNMPYNLRHVKAEYITIWCDYLDWARDAQYEKYGTLWRAGTIAEEERALCMEMHEHMTRAMFLSVLHERYGQLTSKQAGVHLGGSYFRGLTRKDTVEGEYLQKTIAAGLYDYDRDCRLLRKEITAALNKWGIKKATKLALIDMREALDNQHRRIMGDLWRGFPI